MAEITTFTIGGTDVRLLAQYRTMTLEQQINGRSILRVTLRDKSETFRPDLLDVIVLSFDGVQVFGGVIWDLTERAITKSRATGGNTGFEHVVQAVDYAAFTDVALINGIFPADTLDGFLAYCVANLAEYGITLSGSQAAGPSLPDLAWEFLTIRQALDRLATQTGWIWRIDPAGVLRMFDPTSIPATVFVYDPPTGSGILHIEWNKNLNNYFNSMYLRYGPQGAASVTETFTGNGAASSFPLGYTFANLPTMATLNVVIGGTPAVQTVGLQAAPGQWYVNTAQTDLVRVAGAFGSGDTVTFQYFSVSPTNLQVEDAPAVALYNHFAYVVVNPQQLTAAEAQSYAEGQLRRRGGPYRKVTITTTLPGIEVLQSLQVVIAKRNLNDNFLVTEVRLRQLTQIQDNTLTSRVRHKFVWDITCVEGTETTSWLEYFREGPPETGSGVPITPIPLPRVYYFYWLTCAPKDADGVTIQSAGTTAWNNGTWQTLLTSAPVPIAIAGLSVQDIPDLGQGEWEIGVGPTTPVVVATLPAGGNTGASTASLQLPVPLGPFDTGTKVWARFRWEGQLSQTQRSCKVKLLYIPDNLVGSDGDVAEPTLLPVQCTPSAATGLVVTTSATAWTYGSWVQISASIADDWQLLALSLFESATGANLDEMDFEVGIGTTGVTVASLPFNRFWAVAQGYVFDPVVTIPSGSQVQIRSRHRIAGTKTTRVKLSYYVGSLP